MHPPRAVRSFCVAACVAVVSVGLAAVMAVGAPIAEHVAPRTVRFFQDAEARDNAVPTPALVRQFAGLSPATDAFPVKVTFGRRGDGRRLASIRVEPGTSLYGTGEVAGPLLRNGRVTETWNLDAYGYRDTWPSLYQSHPWVLAVRADGSAFGVLADTTWRCEIDLTDGIVFAAEGPAFPVYVIDADSPRGVLEGLGTLTGTFPMPPKWAIGYHQCRYSYNPDSRVREIAEGFRSRNIPCDVIWMDIDYMHGFRTFTFDPEQFPDPAGLNSYLRENGFSPVWMINPGVKVEQGYFVWEQGQAGDHWVKAADGRVYRGEVWPGWCNFPDFTDPRTREWWGTLYKDFMATGPAGIWNDMNEPAIFNVESKTMPEDNRHRGGAYLDRVLPPGDHAQYHNIYGMMMVKASLDGIQKANPDVRPFVLTRANFIGGHRYAATWTGDNAAEWYDLENSIPMILNFGLSGQPMAGPDIGGFIGNGTAELFGRWMGIGAMLPFARGHTGKGNIDKEPWAFNDDVTRISRLALERRYRLMPHFYTLFYEAYRTGVPPMRPTFFADPTDMALRSEDDSFLLGDGLLVVCKTTPLGDRAPVMPKGIWTRFDVIDAAMNEKELPELYLRGGTILPVGPVMQFTGEKPLDPLTLIVCLDESGRARGELYEDAGDGYAYRDGEYRLTRYSAYRDGHEVVVRVDSVEGRMAPPKRNVTIRVIRPGLRPTEVTLPDADEFRVRVVQW